MESSTPKSATPTQSALALLAVPPALLWAGYVIFPALALVHRLDWPSSDQPVARGSLWHGASFDVLVVFLVSHLPDRSEVRVMTGGGSKGLGQTLLRAG